VLVIKGAKALLMKLSNPDRVLSAISSAHPYMKDGVKLVAVPHRLDEVSVLRNLGINAPSPIEHYYNWPGRFTPFSHQCDTSAFLSLTKRGLVLNEIGTGKTSSALWAADYLIEIGKVKKVLVLSPLSTLERVWGDAIFKDLYHRRAVVLHGSAKRRKKLLAQDVDFYILNHDGFKVLYDDLIGKFDLVIVDEAAVYRNGQSQRFKLFYQWLQAHPDVRLWLMTGTPTPNEPPDAWALAKLVGNPDVPKRWTHFRDETMIKVSPFKWKPKATSIDTVRNVLQPAVRFTRDDCLDLPETMFQTREVPLTAEQLVHYKRMMQHLIAEVKTGSVISAVNEAGKLQKLIQISCGVAYGSGGKLIELDCSPRINVVREIIEEAGQKVILFVPLTGTLHMLERELAKNYTVAVVNGEVSASKRNQIFHDFQETSDPRILIAHPATMAHGLTLTAASTVIWYGPITSNEQYVQANGRTERIGKRHVTNVVNIESTPLEKKMYERLQGKQKLQGLLLDLIQEYQHKGL